MLSLTLNLVNLHAYCLILLITLRCAACLLVQYILVSLRIRLQSHVLLTVPIAPTPITSQEHVYQHVLTVHMLRIAHGVVSLLVSMLLSPSGTLSTGSASRNVLWVSLQITLVCSV